MNTITIDQLSKTYRRAVRDAGIKNAFKALFRRKIETINAVRGISFQLEPGSIVGFLGPNGAGKTTTLKMLSGILTPTSGTASVLGFTPWERKIAFRKKIGVVMGQRIQLWWDLPVTESLLLNKILYEIPDDIYHERVRRFAQLLDVVHLLPVASRKLSLGQRMRCELMAALLHEPDVLFLDEPTVGLDVVSQKRIRDFLAQHVRERNMTVLLTSHNMEDIEALCQRVVVIHEGGILFDGDLDALRQKYATTKRLTVQYRGTAPHLAGLEPSSLAEGTMSYDVPREQAHALARSVLETTDVLDLTIEETRIEDVIRALFVSGRSRKGVT